MTPKDPILYDKIKKQIYKKYPIHSAYRSGMLVQEYKKQFKGKGSPYKGQKPLKTGLGRWFKEKWVSDTGKIGYTSKSSVYRPSVRITKKTPTTWSELSEKEIKRAKREKVKTGRVKQFRRR